MACGSVFPAWATVGSWPNGSGQALAIPSIFAAIAAGASELLIELYADSLGGFTPGYQVVDTAQFLPWFGPGGSLTKMAVPSSLCSFSPSYCVLDCGTVVNTFTVNLADRLLS